MIPIIVLVGRTNVGKSTLFNILTKTRQALVGNCEGITRDRQYGYCQLFLNQKVILIDTAGLDIKYSEIEKQAHTQTLKAIKESNLILFVVDAHDGLMPQENEISQKIRRYYKKTILVINKIDGINHLSKINEFYTLGFQNIQKISAVHNQGINALKNKHLIPWIKKEFPNEHVNVNFLEQSLIKIALIGKPNVGKSTLINSLLQEERMITCDTPGTTLDSIETPFTYKKTHYVLIDTAGISKNKNINDNFKKFSVIKTLQTIEKSNITLLIIDASIQICNQDLSLLNFTINAGKGIVIIINKSDLLNPIEKQKIRELIKNKIKFLHIFRIHFISALYKQGILKIFKFIDESYAASQKKISTSALTKTMHMAVNKHQPPTIYKQRVKLKYAHLGSSNPPKIIIHGTRLKYLSVSYKRYLVNFFHYALKIRGTPIQIQLKENFNPYIKKNKH